MEKCCCKESGKCFVGVRLWSTIYSALTATLLSLTSGITFSYSSPALVELTALEDPEFRFGSTLSDIFGASSLVGSILGAFVAGYVAEKWGRKASMAINTFSYVLGYFAILLSYLIQNSAAFKCLLIIGRGISGIGMGWSIIIVPIYISEVAPSKLRGVLVALVETATTSGILLMYGLGAIPNFSYYSIAIVPLAIIALFMLIFAWIPESPRWLLLTLRDRKRAVSVLKYINGPTNTKKIDEILREIESSATAKSSIILVIRRLFCHKPILIPFIISLVVVAMQQLCGIGILVTYAAQIYTRAGDQNPNLTAFYTAGLLFPLSTLPVIVLVEFVGRKILLAISTAGMCIASALLGFQFYFTRSSLCFNSTIPAAELVDMEVQYCNPHLFPMAIASVVLFSLSFEVGVGPLVWVIFSEYVPVQVKGLAGGIILATNRGAGVVLTGTYFNFSDWAGVWYIWWLLGLINLFGFLFIVIFVIETKGKHLEEIPQLFRKKYRSCLR